MKMNIIVVVALFLAIGSVAHAADFTVTAGLTGYDFAGLGTNPTISLTQGTQYVFDLNVGDQPFYIVTQSGAFNQANIYTTGVNGNGNTNQPLTFAVPAGAPATLYYVSSRSSAFGGVINIKPSDGTVSSESSRTDTTPSTKFDDPNSQIPPSKDIEPSTKINDPNSQMPPSKDVEPSSRTNDPNSQIPPSKDIEPSTKINDPNSQMPPSKDIEPSTKINDPNSQMPPSKDIEPSTKINDPNSQMPPSQDDPSRTNPSSYEPSKTEPSSFEPSKEVPPSQYPPSQAPPSQVPPSQAPPSPQAPLSSVPDPGSVPSDSTTVPSGADVVPSPRPSSATIAGVSAACLLLIALAF